MVYLEELRNHLRDIQTREPSLVLSGLAGLAALSDQGHDVWFELLKDGGLRPLSTYLDKRSTAFNFSRRAQGVQIHGIRRAAASSLIQMLHFLSLNPALAQMIANDSPMVRGIFLLLDFRSNPLQVKDIFLVLRLLRYVVEADRDAVSITIHDHNSIRLLSDLLEVLTRPITASQSFPQSEEPTSPPEALSTQDFGATVEVRTNHHLRSAFLASTLSLITMCYSSHAHPLIPLHQQRLLAIDDAHRSSKRLLYLSLVDALPVAAALLVRNHIFPGALALLLHLIWFFRAGLLLLPEDELRFDHRFDDVIAINAKPFIHHSNALLRYTAAQCVVDPRGLGLLSGSTYLDEADFELATLSPAFYSLLPTHYHPVDVQSHWLTAFTGRSLVSSHMAFSAIWFDDPEKQDEYALAHPPGPDSDPDVEAAYRRASVAARLHLVASRADLVASRAALVASRAEIARSLSRVEVARALSRVL